MTDTLSPVAPIDYAATASEAYRSALAVIESVEPRIADATRAELADQRSSLKLIASENYASPAVLLTMGSWLSDKYAEGTIGHRFYAGCQNIDTVESLAPSTPGALRRRVRLRAAALRHRRQPGGILGDLGQPGRAARAGRPGVKGVNDLTEEQCGESRHKFGNQRALGMSLDAGGHLTHGFRPNISGKMFISVRTGRTRRLSCWTTTRCGRLPASSGR